jgi:methionyl-tRNA formyltransferase
MKFPTVKRIIFFGLGGYFISEMKKYSDENDIEIIVFTSPRHIKEFISEGISFQAFLESQQIKYFVSEDINKDKNIISYIDSNTIGLGLGEAWSFSKAIINAFNGNLMDLMGIRLPQYRGGAHYTWQILRKNRIGCSNLQLINEDMVQGEFDSGKIVKTKEYFFPSTAKTPIDYFTVASINDAAFFLEFLEEIKKEKDFELNSVQDSFSIYFPRLYTNKHAFINWGWATEDIFLFICAFDDPYPGTLTFINNNLVRLKKCMIELNDGPFHPFQVGLIYKISNGIVYIASLNGTLIIQEIINDADNKLYYDFAVGDRFYTPIKCIEESMQFKANYDVHGIK